jgi:protoheme IX farnesyltransferase
MGIFLELTKFWIAVTSTLTGLAVYVLSKGGVGWDVVPLFAGILLTACGACALNEVQEWRLDGRMERTRGRPIPSGRIAPRAALALAFALILCGALALWAGNGPEAGALSLFAVAWYNGVYTNLKRWTAFAVVPGALIGAVPPAIGWVAGGQPLMDPRALALCVFFFVWQIPHFWLLLFKYGSEYQAAGYPSLTGLFDGAQLARLTFTWMCATGVSTVLLPLFRAVEAPAVWCLLAAAGAWLIFRAAPVLKAAGDPRPFRSAFVAINLFALVVMGLLAADPYLIRLFPPRQVP